MAKKPQEQEQPPRPVKPAKEGGGLLFPILIAAIAGFACFLVVLGVGGMVSQTASTPTAPPSNRGTLPTQRPSATPVQTKGPIPEKTDAPEETAQITRDPSTPPVEPTEAQPPAQTNPPEATQTPATQNPDPAVSVRPTTPTTPPAKQTPPPAQPSNSGGGGNGTSLSKNSPDSTPVYVSNAGKIHSMSDCSGMRNYTTMTLGEARANANYKFCSNCWH